MAGWQHRTRNGYAHVGSGHQRAPRWPARPLPPIAAISRVAGRVVRAHRRSDAALLGKGPQGPAAGDPAPDRPLPGPARQRRQRRISTGKCAAQLAAGPLTAAELRSARYGITDRLDDLVGCTDDDERLLTCGGPPPTCCSPDTATDRYRQMVTPGAGRLRPRCRHGVRERIGPRCSLGGSGKHDADRRDRHPGAEHLRWPILRRIHRPGTRLSPTVGPLPRWQHHGVVARVEPAVLELPWRPTLEQGWQACVSSVLCTGRCPDPLLPARSTARGRVLLRGETSGTVWCATEDRAGQGVAVLEHREMPDSAKVFQLGIRHRLVLVR